MIIEQPAERVVVNLNEINLYSAWECSINVSNFTIGNIIIVVISPFFVYIFTKKRTCYIHNSLIFSFFLHDIIFVCFLKLCKLCFNRLYNILFFERF